LFYTGIDIVTDSVRHQDPTVGSDKRCRPGESILTKETKPFLVLR
jgi:hypothetical protein